MAKKKAKIPYKDCLFPILEAEGIDIPAHEHKFAKESHKRQWRFDFAWLDKMIALEVEGGVWISGRHNRGSGFVKDMEKYNTACLLGWRIIRCTPKELYNGEVVEKWLKKILKK